MLQTCAVITISVTKLNGSSGVRTHVPYFRQSKLPILLVMTTSIYYHGIPDWTQTNDLQFRKLPLFSLRYRDIFTIFSLLSFRKSLIIRNNQTQIINFISQYINLHLIFFRNISSSFRKLSNNQFLRSTQINFAQINFGNFFKTT